MSVTKENRHIDSKIELPVSVRVPLYPYLIALFSALFVAAFLIYMEWDAASAVLFATAFIIIPLLALRDNIIFDGKRIIRTGLIPRTWAKFLGQRNRLKLTDIENVETHASRTIKRGSRVTYHYSTLVSGKGAAFNISSGGEDYRRFVRTLLPNLHNEVLDTRSIELREYLCEKKETLTKAASMNIPPTDVLESSLAVLNKGPRTAKKYLAEAFTDESNKRSDELRQMANELRISGSLLQAIEAFRRALLIKPRDGWLLLEFARCLESFAGSERDRNASKKAAAVMRLAEKRAGGDGYLLARMGETYFQFGDARRAAMMFERSKESIGNSFRALRGMAEIALREGKIAHVILNFSSANSVAQTPAMRRWTQREADYFDHLNSNDEYMELEVSRVNLLEKLLRVRRTALRICIFGLPLIIFGVMSEESFVANAGWTLCGAALLLSLILMTGSRMMESRIPFKLIEDEDQ
jgi:tetratricopeptide (TPR) repeat protein